MKLLFDENLSPKLPQLLATIFPGSVHVRDRGLKGVPDENIWRHARDNGFVLISKDSDFVQQVSFTGTRPSSFGCELETARGRNLFK